MYIFDKFPLSDDTLKNAQFVEFHNRMNAHFTDVEYFAHRYSTVLQLTSEQCNVMFDEIVDYQLLESIDILDDT